MDVQYIIIMKFYFTKDENFEFKKKLLCAIDLVGKV